jgi:hypothetical protein
MVRNTDNRRRAFADVVSIDAWHASFDGGKAIVDLHADVMFGTARLGGEPESPVRFRLSVKRAELVVIIPETEPVAVDPASVAREFPIAKGKKTETFQRTEGRHLKAGINLTLSRKGAAAEAGAKASAQQDQTTVQKWDLSTPVKGFKTLHSKTANGDYRWIITSYNATALEGSPWDATKEPRLKLIDKRGQTNKSLEPAVRLEVRCRVEDLEILDIHDKDEGRWKLISSAKGFKNRMAAATAFIRNKLAEEGLHVTNIEDQFGEITLANVTAEGRKS